MGGATSTTTTTTTSTTTTTTTTTTTSTTTTVPSFSFCEVSNFVAKYKLNMSSDDFFKAFDLVSDGRLNQDRYMKLVCRDNGRKLKVECRKMGKPKGLSHAKIISMHCNK